MKCPLNVRHTGNTLGVSELLIGYTRASTDAQDPTAQREWRLPRAARLRRRVRVPYLFSQIPIEDQRDPQDGTRRNRLLQGYRKEILNTLSEIRRDLYDHSMYLTPTPN